MSESLEGLITYAELTDALKATANGKSPGIDGFSVEFLKFFWADIGVYVLRSINRAYQTATMSISHRRGVITCIPKSDKNRCYLKNWRPISLLIAIYKLASACISSRLKQVLPSIIHQDQKGFLAGRFIGENTRLMYDVLFDTNKQQIPGLLLLIDFEKAFDSVSWQFINKVLQFFKFGPSLQKWVKILYSDIQSCVIQNGHFSEFFEVERGCRHGDPLSPYLFVLCAEILGLMVRQDNSIKGININGTVTVLSQYADDTQLYLDGSENSLQAALKLLELFRIISGLKVNVEKTRVIWIGSSVGSPIKLCQHVKLDWTQSNFKVLWNNLCSKRRQYLEFQLHKQTG